MIAMTAMILMILMIVMIVMSVMSVMIVMIVMIVFVVGRCRGRSRGAYVSAPGEPCSARSRSHASSSMRPPTASAMASARRQAAAMHLAFSWSVSLTTRVAPADGSARNCINTC